MRAPLFPLLALTTACAVGRSAPTLVYGQRAGSFDGAWIFGSGLKMRIADDFSVATDVQVACAEFWGFAPDYTEDFSGITFEISIWREAGPGLGPDNSGPVYAETFTPTALDPTRSFGRLHAYSTKFTAEFSNPVALLAGTTYWFAIGVSDNANFAWVVQGASSPDPISPTTVLWGDANYDGWDGSKDYYADGNPMYCGLAFGLTSGAAAIPLPTTAALAATGLLGLGILRGRSNR